MLITLVAHPVSDYGAWAVEAVKDANRAIDPATQKGRETFLSLACVGCHTVKGTPASGRIGPELTHVASKKSIAGGALSPVNEENLTRWIKNPPAVKPGTQMPNLGLSDQQVHDIVQWLLTLK
jgi:cytochrome c oxidase subunit 2